MSNKPKIIGITCDVWKLDKFREALKKAGFEDFTTKKLFAKVYIIKVVTIEDRKEELLSVCKEVEQHFQDLKKQ